MIKISPSILAGDFLHLADEVKKLEEAGVDYIHFDIMDGNYVPNISYGFKFMSAIKAVTKIPFDVHLMINDPGKYLSRFIEAGSNIITFHAEVTDFPIRLINEIKKNKCQAGISLNPVTPVSSIIDIIDQLDMVLIMSVEPGFYGQEFIPNSYNKIAQLKEIKLKNKLKTIIAVDGGVGKDNYKQLSKAGADLLVIGNDFFKQENYRQYIENIRNI